MSEFGIPYMGSKATIAASIALNFPKADHFYDLFGGGFSMTHCMLTMRGSHYKTFHYNEIKSDVVELVKNAINGDFNYDVFKPGWVSRKDFFENLQTDAYVRCLWSFGNNQKGYLFSEEIEEYKRSMHIAIVFDEFNSLTEEVLGFNKWPTIAKTIKQRRLYLRQKIEFYRKTKIPKILHQFLDEKQLDRLQQLQRLEQLQQLQQLQRLERLQQLQRLERLQQLQQLSITALDYRDVEILPNSVVYCDIPYADTVDYGEFNHKEFFDWAATRDFPVYISEYNITDTRFKLIYSVNKRVLLIITGSSNKIKQEKVYWNGRSTTLAPKGVELGE